MTASRRVFVVVVAVVVIVAAVVYLALPLLWHERAALACLATVPGEGSYTTEWRPVPTAHWECVSSPDGDSSSVIDLGWWPTVPASAIR